MNSNQIQNNNLTLTKKKRFSFESKEEIAAIKQYHDFLINRSGAQSGILNANTIREIYPSLYMKGSIDFESIVNKYEAQIGSCNNKIVEFKKAGFKIQHDNNTGIYTINTPKGHEYTFEINTFIMPKIDTTFYTTFDEKSTIDKLQSLYFGKKPVGFNIYMIKNTIAQKKSTKDMSLAERIEETVTGGRGYHKMPRGSYVDEINHSMKESIFASEPYKENSQADFQLYCMELRDQGYLPFIDQKGDAIFPPLKESNTLKIKESPQYK